jgi:hypothetical protein
MATKERFQNPVVGDLINLRLFSYNSNNFADFASVDKVDIYFLDREEITAANPDGRRLVESFGGGAVTLESTGTYLLPVTLDEKSYNIGQYIDVWTITASTDQPSQTTEQCFEIYPDLWYTTPIPIVYDFSFHFQPNKFRQGSKQYLIIEINPNVPTAGELRSYYENLAIVSDLKLSIEHKCGDCLPAEQDLRLIVDKVSVDYREKRRGFYQFDTEDLECGIYDIWFQLDFGGNRYISDRHQIQIYD